MTDFRHRMDLEVRFRDIDALRHVNNASFFTYLEEARVHYFIDLLHAEAFERLPLILAAARIDFRAPILFGQVVDIGTRVDWIGNTSISMSHRMTASPDDRLVAEAGTILVCYDYDAAGPMPVPADWRSTFTEWEGRDLRRPVTNP